MRSPVSVTQGAAGASAWIPLDYQQRPFNVALIASLDYQGSLTYSVQYSPDNPWLQTPMVLTQAAGVGTATFANPHGLVVGDSITSLNTGDPNMNGVFPVASVPTANSLTFSCPGATLALGLPPSAAVLMRVFNHDTMVNLTARQDGNFLAPVRAVRVNVTAYTAGKVTLEVLQGHARG
jgi:hypothetical protein